MNRHLIQGIVGGALFALPITWIAASDALASGSSLEILARAVFGLAAGFCIGALIAANFAMLALEEKEHAVARRHVEALQPQRFLPFIICRWATRGTTFHGSPGNEKIIR